METEKLETLTKPIELPNGTFRNPWSTWDDVKFSTLLKWSLFAKNNTNLPSDRKVKDNI